MSHVNRYSIKANPNKSSMSDGDKNTQAESGMGMPELPEAGGGLGYSTEDVHLA